MPLHFAEESIAKVNKGLKIFALEEFTTLFNCKNNIITLGMVCLYSMYFCHFELWPLKYNIQDNEIDLTTAKDTLCATTGICKGEQLEYGSQQLNLKTCAADAYGFEPYRFETEE